MFNPAVEERALHHQEYADVLVHEGYVLDQGAKAFVTLLVPPTAQHFCVTDVGQFRERFRRKGCLWVLVERVEEGWTDDFVPRKARASGQPECVKVVDIDGRVLVLEPGGGLNYVPHEGACVQLVRAMDWKYVDEKELDRQEKREGKYRWV